MTSDHNILIIDDDPDFANFVYDVVTSLNLKCIMTTNSKDFMNAYDESITLVFLDLNIPDIDGIELLRFIDDKKFDVDIILMSGVDKRVLESAQEFAQSRGLSLIDRFQKPIRLDALEELIKKHTINKPTKVETKIIPKKNENTFVVTKEELITAIENDNFVVFYQPKIHIATGKLAGVEVLVRWQHPKHGLIFPDQFITLTESYGLIDQLSWVIIKKSLKELSALKMELGLSLMIALNLSPYSLHDLTFPDKVIEIINQFNISPSEIIFEVTETGLLKELSTVLDILTRLRLKNIQLSIDDFGTGYAMMSQLRLIPATEIKIDKSFVQSMLEVNSAMVTVRKVIEIGHELGMKVIAEGVETEAQLKFLESINCDVAQGYYFSKPIPLEQLQNWIVQQQRKY